VVEADSLYQDRSYCYFLLATDLILLVIDKNR